MRQNKLAPNKQIYDMELLYGVYAQHEYVGIYLRCPSSQCERLLSEKDPLNMYEIYIYNKRIYERYSNKYILDELLYSITVDAYLKDFRVNICKSELI